MTLREILQEIEKGRYKVRGEEIPRLYSLPPKHLNARLLECKKKRCILFYFRYLFNNKVFHFVP